MHTQSLERYSRVQPGICGVGGDITTFDSVCSRFVPPHAFIPVALPRNSTSIEIDR